MKISINKSRSEVVLEGNADSVSEVVPDIYAIIMEVKEREKLDREVELLARQVIVC